MMILLLILFLSLIPFSAGAQESVEPDEPDIILPEVILQIDDASVEDIEAGIPAEEELLPPPQGRKIPLPEEEELRIEEPAQPMILPEPGLSPGAGRGYSLTAQAVLGAGSMNHNFSSISLYRVGEEPRFSLRFLHEMLDGFGGHSPGAGFNFREDSLAGGLRFHLGNLQVDAGGSLSDTERGLQGLGPFVSRLHRRGALDLDLQYPLGDRFSLSGTAGATYASQLLTGDNPRSESEIVASPEIGARMEWEKAWLGLNSRYDYRTRFSSGDSPLHRVAVDGTAGVEFSNGLRLEGTGGWFWSNALGSLLPFEISLSGNLFSSLTFRAAGGYRVERQDLYQILGDYDLVEPPDTQIDNHGWFGDLGTSFSFIRKLSFQAGATLAGYSAMPEPSADPAGSSGLSPDTGLYLFRQKEAVRLAANFGLRWNMLKSVDLSAGLSTEFLDRPAFMPRYRLQAAIEAGEPAGKWGGKGSLLFEFDDELPVPLLELSAFYNISEAVALIVEGNDLLYPFIEGPRYSWYPFEEPGIRATFKVQITL